MVKGGCCWCAHPAPGFNPGAQGKPAANNQGKGGSAEPISRLPMLGFVVLLVLDLMSAVWEGLREGEGLFGSVLSCRSQS